jgi:hypothetical protein
MKYFFGSSGFCNFAVTATFKISTYDLYYTYSKDKAGHGSFRKVGVTSLFLQPGRLFTSQNSDI